MCLDYKSIVGIKRSSRQMNDIIIRIPKRMNYIDLFMSITLLFPVFTSVVKAEMMNRALFGLLIGFYVLTSIQRGLSKKTIVFILVFLINLVFALLATSFPMRYMHLLFYYPFFIMYTFFTMDFKDYILNFFNKYKILVMFILNFWTIVVGISIFLPSSYYIKEAGESYFGSYVGSIFRVGPAAVYIMGLSMIAMVLYRKKWAIVYSVVPLYAFLTGSSRTYLILGICIFVIQWFWIVEKKKIFYLSIIPIGIMLLVLIFLTPIGEKILHTLDDSNYGSFWFRITSGRSLLWYNLFEALKEEPLIHLIFGSGIEFSFQTVELWAHNDYIELICTFGIWGAIQYIVAMFMSYTFFFKTKYKIPVIVIICVVLVWLFNAFFNMHYPYFCVVLAYPIILIAISKYYDTNAPE